MWGSAVRIRSGIDQKKVRPFSSHDEPLLAVEQEIVAFILCRGGGAEKIGAAPGFGEAFRCKNVPFEKGFYVFFLLVVPAVEDNGVADQFCSHPESAGKNIAQHPDLLHDHAGGDPVHIPSAPFFGIAASHKIAAAGLLEKFFRKLDLVGIHIQNHLLGEWFLQIPGPLF